MAKSQQSTFTKQHLRKYQKEGINEIHQSFREGLKRVIFHLSTGGGKSITFSSIVWDHYINNLPVIVVVKRRQLIDQASKNLDNFRIPHGVLMANHWRKKPNEKIQIASIDTIHSRSNYHYSDDPRCLVIVDECHDVRGSGAKYPKLFEVYDKSYIVGFTATPYADNSFFQKIVCPIEGYELRDQGFLVPERTYIPSSIDVSQVKSSGGDYNKKQLFEASSGSQIIGDIVKSWKTHAEGRATLLFAVNVEHSKMIRDKFLAEGISAVHLDANDSLDARKKALNKLSQGLIKIITNCDVMSTGVDIPMVSCIQLARPTRSVIWHIQSIGRGLRPFPGKKDCIIIDNAGNTLRHGSIYMPRIATIEKRKKRLDPLPMMRTCAKCYFIFTTLGPCPQCGFADKKVRNIDYVEGDLIHHQVSEEEIRKTHFLNRYKTLRKAARFGKKKWIPSYEYQQLKKEFGVDICKKFSNLVSFPGHLL